jgi:hypothetical protein
MKLRLWPLALLTLAAMAAASTEPNTTVPAPLPDDAALEAAGARVGTITIRATEIFDLSDPRENKKLYRLVNRLHVQTRAGALRAQLLFRSGEPYRGRLLQETERNLRQLNFVREPRVRPVAWHDGVVDILVETHDVWTLQLGPSFGRSGGKNETSVEVQDDNLFGFGKTLLAGNSHNVDRSSSYFEWRDPTVFGSHWKDSLRWAHNSDGRDWRVQLWQPFYALDVRHSFGVGFEDRTANEPRYRLGTEYDHYAHAFRFFDVYTGWSPGLRAGHVLRLSAGWRSQRDRFGAVTTDPAPVGNTLAPVPADRELVYPYLRCDWLTDDFHTTRNQDLIERTEDLQFGLNASLQVGAAAHSFGADRQALVYAGQATYGWHLTDRQQLYASVGVDGRVEHGAGVDVRTASSLAWYWRTSRRTLTHIRIAGDSGHALDLDHYYLLGGDNGLRGYPLRYQEGSARALLKLEERAYSDWSIWRLFSVGGAVFFDAGRTFGSNTTGTPQLGWLRDIGIGLRLGNDRASLGNVIHIDLATPLNGAGLNRLQVLVSTEATF